MADYFTNIALQYGISIWLLAIIVVWSTVWKLLALWKSARNTHIAWFIVLFVINMAGILSILYIYVFSKMSCKTKPKKKKVSKKKK